MANRFWVGGTGTWDAANTTSWSTTTGGGGGASVPGTGDVAIFDGSSGGGTVTVDSPNGAGVVTVQQITMGAFTGTLDFAANNNNVTLSVALSGTGTGARELKMGSGTWTFSTVSANNIMDFTTMTNLANPTTSLAGATIAVTGAGTGERTLVFGLAATLGTVTISAHAGGTTGRGILINGPASATLTIGTLNVSAPNWIAFTGSGARVYAITNGFNFTGTSSAQVGLTASTTAATPPTISSANTMGGTYLTLGNLSFAGGGNLTATNSFDLGAVSISGGGTKSITAPTGGGGARIVYG